LHRKPSLLCYKPKFGVFVIASFDTPFALPFDKLRTKLRATQDAMDDPLVLGRVYQNNMKWA
jgi:hypothetical protein